MVASRPCGTWSPASTAPQSWSKEGKFTAEDYGPYSMMKHKGSELAPLGTFEKKVPADIVAKVRAEGRHPGRQVHREGGQPAKSKATVVARRRAPCPLA